MIMVVCPTRRWSIPHYRSLQRHMMLRRQILNGNGACRLYVCRYLFATLTIYGHLADTRIHGDLKRWCERGEKGSVSGSRTQDRLTVVIQSVAFKLSTWDKPPAWLLGCKLTFQCTDTLIKIKKILHPKAVCPSLRSERGFFFIFHWAEVTCLAWRSLYVTIFCGWELEFLRKYSRFVLARVEMCWLMC